MCSVVAADFVSPCVHAIFLFPHLHLFFLIQFSSYVVINVFIYLILYPLISCNGYFIQWVGSFSSYLGI